MKHALTILILAAGLTAAAGAEDTTALQVAPSDTVIYPDASQILNKTDPAAKPTPAPKPASTAAAATTTPATTTPAPASPAALPSARPLTASAPVPASPKAVPVAPGPPGPLRGWFLKWTFEGDESLVRSWASAAGRPVSVRPAGPGRWEALQGPLDALGLKAALEGQAGRAVLVRL